MSQATLWQSGQVAESLRRENDRYLNQQIITYLGNKRSLLTWIGEAVERVKLQLGQERLDIFDVFSGTGIVSRMFKQHANRLFVNDLETYSRITSECFLSNANQLDLTSIKKTVQQVHNTALAELAPGFITELYSPQDERNIQPGERVFYTRRNAMYLDTARRLIDEVPAPLRSFVLAPLIAKASVHANTSGVFKGFYKDSRTGLGRYGGTAENALARIRGEISLEMPVFSDCECESTVYQMDAMAAARQAPAVDLAYLDPPYNQHPYGSNYFMLNLVANYRRPGSLSRVSGIPTDWNRSAYNKKPKALAAFRQLLHTLKCRFALISFNSEGFITKDEMLDLLQTIGKVSVMETPYNTFRGSRNLRERATHVTEYLYLVERRWP